VFLKPWNWERPHARRGIRGETQKNMFLNGVLKLVFRFDLERGIQE
jgi:hypothetical protein